MNRANPIGQKKPRQRQGLQKLSESVALFPPREFFSSRPNNSQATGTVPAAWWPARREAQAMKVLQVMAFQGRTDRLHSFHDIHQGDLFHG